MKRLELSSEKQKEYDEIINKMMSEIEELCESVPSGSMHYLDGEKTKIYREVTEKYIPILNDLLENG